MEDLRAPDGSLHTDGCGLIRGSFAREICVVLKLPLDTSGMSLTCDAVLWHFVILCCADVRFPVFQIRRGGVKGLLISYPDEDFECLCNNRNKLLDKREVGSEIVLAFRASMLKYEGGPTMLELNDHSVRSNHARLNESFILLLLTNGVRIEVRRMRWILLDPSIYTIL